MNLLLFSEVFLIGMKGVAPALTAQAPTGGIYCQKALELPSMFWRAESLGLSIKD